MFEFSVARKYLSPRWRQLSVSIISLIAIVVISLVVWLVVVFFSVTNGLEKRWIQKLIAVTAPVRVVPTEAYYRSYYYLIDSVSAGSDYLTKSIGEKLIADQSDPYDPSVDQEFPREWKIDREEDGSLKDLVKKAFRVIEKIPEVRAKEFEVTMSNMRLRLVRQDTSMQQTQAFLNQATYLGSLDPANGQIAKTLLPITPADLSNMLAMLAVASDNIQEDNPNSINRLDPKTISERFRTFFGNVEVQKLKTSEFGWVVPKGIFPESGTLRGKALYRGDRLIQVEIPGGSSETRNNQGFKSEDIEINFKQHKPFLKNGDELPPRVPLVVMGGDFLPAQLVKNSVNNANDAAELRFNVEYKIQGLVFEGEVPYGILQIGHADIVNGDSPLWVHRINQRLVLPTDSEMGEGILLPKTFKDAGVLVGDRGFISYYAPSPTAVQEQRMPMYVAGFYDPGIIPLGGKFLLANPQLIDLIRSAHSGEDSVVTNGIDVRFDDIDRAESIKKALEQGFEQAGIGSYWKVETFREFEFTKALIQQLRSDKTLFTLIATVIIIVACSNIISMLIILVNDKKVEIGILRSMGASSISIATIFGFCSLVIGMVGSFMGVIAALITLKNLDLLVYFLNKIQGHQAFNPMFYGESLPNDISFEALAFVVLATSLVSLTAGIVPAAKACLLKPSAILRSE